MEGEQLAEVLGESGAGSGRGGAGFGAAVRSADRSDDSLLDTDPRTRLCASPMRSTTSTALPTRSASS